MPSPIKMRTDYSAPQLRVLAKSAKTNSQSRRLLSLAAVLDGQTGDIVHGIVDALARGQLLHDCGQPARVRVHGLLRVERPGVGVDDGHCLSPLGSNKVSDAAPPTAAQQMWTVT